MSELVHKYVYCDRIGDVDWESFDPYARERIEPPPHRVCEPLTLRIGGLTKQQVEEFRSNDVEMDHAWTRTDPRNPMPVVVMHPGRKVYVHSDGTYGFTTRVRATRTGDDWVCIEAFVPDAWAK